MKARGNCSVGDVHASKFVKHLFFAINPTVYFQQHFNFSTEDNTGTSWTQQHRCVLLADSIPTGCCRARMRSRTARAHAALAWAVGRLWLACKPRAGLQSEPESSSSSGAHGIKDTHCMPVIACPATTYCICFIAEEESFQAPYRKELGRKIIF